VMCQFQLAREVERHQFARVPRDVHRVSLTCPLYCQIKYCFFTALATSCQPSVGCCPVMQQQTTQMGTSMKNVLCETLTGEF
jgi:hypothetical protein